MAGKWLRNLLNGNDVPTSDGTRSEEEGFMVLHVDDSNFKETVLEADLPVLVDFWAPWCMPCRMLAPVVEQLAAEYDGRLVVAKMNTDESPATPGQFGIMGIPTLILFKNGAEVERVVGVQPKQSLTKKIDAHLAA